MDKPAGQTQTKRFILIGGAIIALLLAFFILWYIQRSSGNLELKQRQFSVEVVISEAAKQQGLSGRDGLGDNQGMLFQYDAVANRCLWMKDMRFDIDMLWLNADKAVTAIETNVSPDTYPRTYCHQGQYLLEVPAGTAETLNLKIGEMAKF